MGNSRSLRSGDIARIVDLGCFAYVQYIGRHAAGDMIAVMPTCLDMQPDCYEAVLATPGAYPILYPLKAAVRQGLCVVVANLPPVFPIPTKTRRPIFAVGGGVEGWFIDHEDGSTTVQKQRLTDAEASIPLRIVFSHDILKSRIQEGWEPSSYV